MDTYETKLHPIKKNIQRKLQKTEHQAWYKLILLCGKDWGRGQDWFVFGSHLPDGALLPLRHTGLTGAYADY